MASLIRLVQRCRSNEGAQLVEFALVLPLLLLIVLAIAEFGFVFQRYEVITNAAREGARMAVLPGYGNDPAGIDVIKSRVRAYVTAGRVPTTGGNPGNPAVDVVTTSIPVGGGRPAMSARRVTVTYTHTYMFLPRIAGWFGASYTTTPLVAVSEMRKELGS
jgi:Flp pilus assembly protein TadG